MPVQAGFFYASTDCQLCRSIGTAARSLNRSVELGPNESESQSFTKNSGQSDQLNSDENKAFLVVQRDQIPQLIHQEVPSKIIVRVKTSWREPLSIMLRTNHAGTHQATLLAEICPPYSS